MKKFTSLFTLICALFVTTATAQVNQTVVFDFVNNAWGIPTYEATNFSGVKSQTVYNDGENSITINPTANKGSFYYDGDCLRLQKIGSKIILPAFDFAVEKIEVAGSPKASSYKNADINIFTAGKAVSTAVAGLTESHTFEIAQENQTAGNIYEIVIGSGGGNYSSIVYISCIKVYPAASDEALTIIAPVLDNGTGVYTEPVTVKISSPTTEIEGVEDVYFYYTTDGYEPDQECEEIEDGTITISESCTLKVVLEFTYGGEIYISESTAAEYIISEEVTYPKATVMAGGEYFISANNAIALPYNNGILPTQPTTAEGDNISDAIYYAYCFENAGNGEFYIRDTNGMYLSASGLSTKDEIKISTTYHNCAWNVTIEDGIAKIRKEGFVLAYNNNAIVAVREENTNATTIYPSLYGIANAPSVFSYTPDSYATELKTISITFSEAVRVEGITSSDQFPIYNAEDDAYPVGMGNWNHSGEILTIVLENAITTNGDYYIIIPAECITSEITGKKPEEDLRINLVIYNEDQTSIKNINCDNNNITIYDLNGRRVEKITNAGIYIINGKATLVK
ncbi:MAG: Ig-like domain-containing protein [Bacteroidaceae bacterium]|nr:Ig-like domain-containing protein [Bacteroidaceae bacterium]